MKFFAALLVSILILTDYAVCQSNMALFTMDNIFCKGFSRRWDQKDGYNIYTNLDGLNSQSVSLIIDSREISDGAFYLHGTDGAIIRISYDENQQMIGSFRYELSKVEDPISSHSS